MRKSIIKIMLALILMLIPASVKAVGDDVNIQSETDALAGTVAIVSDGTPQFGESLAVDVSNITNNTGTLSYQWARDGVDIENKISNSYTLVKEDIGASISVKVQSSIETGILISQSVVAEKADREAPAPPTFESGDHYSVTLVQLLGYEYKVEGRAFSSSNICNNLKSNTQYTFYQRYAETDTHKASPSSAGLSVTTEYLVLSDTSKDIGTLNDGDGVLITGEVRLYGTKAIRVYCSAGSKLTLDSATINVSGMSGECAIEFEGSGNQLVLKGSNCVKSGSGRAGIETNGSLAILGSGSLNAAGGSNGAGIGGSNGENAGTIIISSGSIVSKGGANAAGIGGGNGGNGGIVSVSGGFVYAAGSSNDIGGGLSSTSQGSLNISGASIVFMLNNTSPAPSAASHVFKCNETVAGGAAYGYSLPSIWSEGQNAYAYIKYCTVTFDTNGGSNIAQQDVGMGTSISTPDAPAKSEVYFGGWYSDSALTTEFDVQADKIYADTTLYAAWDVKVNIQTNDGGSTTPKDSAFVQIGKDLLLECVPVDDYYVSEITSDKKYNIIDNGNNTYTIEAILEADTIEVLFDTAALLGTVAIDHDGTAECGDEIGVNTTKIENNTGTLSYQWTRNDKDISGAVKEKYTLTKDDVDCKIGIKVKSDKKEGVLTYTLTDAVQKAMKAVPLAPTSLEKTTSSITLNIVEGCEYKLGEDGTWQKSNVFSDLEPETEYVFYQRYAETDTHKQSKDSFSAHISTNGFHVTEVTFSKDSVKIYKGDVKDLAELLRYSIYPKEARNQNVTWTSSNERVAMINSTDGTITALQEGKTVITITCDDTQFGTFTDTCSLQVYDPVENGEDTYMGTLIGKLTDSSGNILSGYNITLYSNPITIKTNSAGEYYIQYIPYTSHVLVVEDGKENEIGRFTVKWILGDKANAYIDEENNIVNLTYTGTTTSVKLPIEVNSTFDSIKIKDVQEIEFEGEEEQGAIPKKMYVLILMGIIAACIIGVGYILYIGRIQQGQYEDEDNEFYKQQLLEDNNDITTDER